MLRHSATQRTTIELGRAYEDVCKGISRPDGSRGANRVVARPAVGGLERFDGMDHLDRPRVRRLEGVPVLQRSAQRELV